MFVNASPSRDLATKFYLWIGPADASPARSPLQKSGCANRPRASQAAALPLPEEHLTKLHGGGDECGTGGRHLAESVGLLRPRPVGRGAPITPGKCIASRSSFKFPAAEVHRATHLCGIPQTWRASSSGEKNDITSADCIRRILSQRATPNPPSPLHLKYASSFSNTVKNGPAGRSPLSAQSSQRKVSLFRGLPF